MDEIESLIRAKGEKIEVSGNFHFSLSEEKIVWFLENGEVNLFAIERKNGKAEGPRTLITHFATPFILLHIESEPQALHDLVGVTETECCLWKVPFKEIETNLGEDPDPLHRWIDQLAHFYEKELLAEPETYLTPKTSYPLKKGEKVSLKRKSKINWVSVERGKVEFLGIPSLQLPEAPFPLTYHGWLQSKTEALVHTSETTTAWKEGLDLFHQILLSYLVARKSQETQFTHALYLQQKEDEEKNINHSMREMVSILNPFESLKFYGGLDPLFLACQTIGEQMGITFQMPEECADDEKMHVVVSAIAHASQIRFRQVSLKGKWWKKDCGPLLGFHGKENKPVALIRKRFRGYVMIDSETGVEKKIDHSSLNATAYTFYIPLPDDVCSGRGVLSFFLKRQIKEFIPLILYGSFAALLSLVTPFMIAALLNRAIPDVNLPLLGQISLALFGAAISSSVFIYFRSLCFVRIEGISSHQVQSALWDRLLKLPVSFFRKEATGNLIMRVFSVERIRILLSGKATRILFSGVFSLFYIIAMAFLAPPLALIAIGAILVSFLLTLGCAAFYARMQKQIYDLQGKINVFLVQLIPAAGRLRISGAENNAFSKWAHAFAQNTKSEFKAQHIYNFVTSLNYVLPFLMYFLIFAYVIAHGGYSAGTFLAFNAAFVSFYLATTDLNNTLLEITPIWPLWNRAKVIIEEPLEERLLKTKPGVLTGEISVDELFFKYEKSGTEILQNICFKVNPKEFIGIIGPSGSGKSTLIRLLMGFERPTSGTIYYDGRDLFSLALDEVRKQFGVVLQDEGVASGTIFDNLACGGIYSSEQIQRALEISGFAEDVQDLPMGLHTYLSVGGDTLSGGQQQRLLIARAILSNPRILLLDEATSALDTKNQANVIESINKLDVTRIVIAHRLSTIRQADRIYVMEKGEFVQTGTFEELAVQPGLFSEMLKRQKL